MHKVLVILFLVIFPVLTGYEVYAKNNILQQNQDYKEGVMQINALSMHSHNENKTHMSFRYYSQGHVYDETYRLFDEEIYEDSEDASPAVGVHEFDLNGDGENEIILRMSDEFFTCNSIGCHHGIVSVNDDGSFRRLGFIKYTEVDIAPTETNGVRDIYSYDNKLNDYSPTLYVWNTDKSIYEAATGSIN